MSFTMRVLNDTTKYGVCLLFSLAVSQQGNLVVCGFC